MTEAGVRLSKSAAKPGELRRLALPPDGSPKEVQLELGDAMLVGADIADSDLTDALEQEGIPGVEANDPPVT
jgi:hypothetical protein